MMQSIKRELDFPKPYGAEGTGRDPSDLNASRTAGRRKREFIPTERKDELYWDRRRKNNEAAKRSREKRRVNDVVLESRLAVLGQENAALKAELLALKLKFGPASSAAYAREVWSAAADRHRGPAPPGAGRSSSSGVSERGGSCISVIKHSPHAPHTRVKVEPAENRSYAQENRSYTQENRSDPQENRNCAQENRSYTQENRSDPQENRSCAQENHSDPQENRSDPQENRSCAQENRSYTQENRSDPQENRSDPQENRSCAQENRSYTQQNCSCAQENRSYTQENRSDPQENRSCAQENRSDPQENRSCAQENRSDPQENRSCAQENRSYTQENRSCAQENRSYTQENRSDPQENRSCAQENRSDPQENRSCALENRSCAQENRSDPQENRSCAQENRSDPQENRSCAQKNLSPCGFSRAGPLCGAFSQQLSGGSPGASPRSSDDGAVSKWSDGEDEQRVPRAAGDPRSVIVSTHKAPHAGSGSSSALPHKLRLKARTVRVRAEAVEREDDRAAGPRAAGPPRCPLALQVSAMQRWARRSRLTSSSVPYGSELSDAGHSFLPRGSASPSRPTARQGSVSAGRSPS
ncbi:nuclear factor interleukin-3-regulated protein [Pseudoliparis swirei]|uniref:nuclear factor interleukin-3-regulated protein n=1 Tax=Pseudoliparis swirei TaxID=2059687 RepID=UPI0024BEF29D|nr:nuclear factor interleukin-3-regulated protein [Pseudoliparis swirei]XP_056289017.1 nuclear factor interleukin-3-regulated protein [Pseudoliparis swirei]XP_056289018.1 nuclear factor interleukin-3-regulated protein [Pseudoliparis swirei]XP_056289019.1 nuclear factor interleukin-3-regulated protein [Pseudoliparis swirei]XP_056289020.1 nuclear factor interleukin-3-regulated protein [Pseudoliparis swirei]